MYSLQILVEIANPILALVRRKASKKLHKIIIIHFIRNYLSLSLLFLRWFRKNVHAAVFASHLKSMAEEIPYDMTMTH